MALDQIDNRRAMRGDQRPLGGAECVAVTAGNHVGAVSTLVDFAEAEAFQGCHQLARLQCVKKCRERTAEHSNDRSPGRQHLLCPDHAVYHHLGVLGAAKAIAATNAAVIHDLCKAGINFDGLDRTAANAGIAATTTLFICNNRFHGYLLSSKE